MPGRNGTGPLGQGAMTGRGLGVCTGANVGLCGMRGLGMRRGYSATGNPAYAAGLAQKDILNEQKAILENQLEAIRKRLDSLPEDSK